MAMPLGLFGLKFLEWWYSSERSEVVRRVTSLPVPPPPGAVRVSLTSPPSLVTHPSLPLFLPPSSLTLRVYRFQQTHDSARCVLIHGETQQLLRAQGKYRPPYHP